MKAMMAKMGIQSSEVDANRVIIECNDKEIVIDAPQITKIVMQGVTSFQIAGDVSENVKEIKIAINDDDIKMVQEKTGVTDIEKIKEALAASNGDIAEAILSLTDKE
jgi:alpha-NAC-related protein